MATATKEKKGKPRRFEALLPVKFKTVPFGESTVTVGFSVPRENCNIGLAEESFCGKRVSVRLILGGSDPSQGVLWDDVTFDIESIVDIKKFTVTPKLISAGLCFNLESLGDAADQLRRFAQKQGMLYILKIVGDAKDEETDSERKAAADLADDKDGKDKD